MMKRKVSIVLLCIIITLHSMNPGVFADFTVSVNVKAQSVPFSPSTATVMTSVKAYMLARDTSPDFSSIWNLFDMVRSGLGVPSSYQETFYKKNIEYLKKNNWQITKNRYTDYSKLILAMTSIGKNAQNIEGHNLFYYLSDFSNVKKQGFNGPIWALIALKCHPTYQIPKNAQAKEQTTEEGLIDYLLDRQISGGGWALSGTKADTDITGMTIQALASYYGKRNDVTKAIDQAVNWLSTAQLSSGGYGTMGIETSESAAQVIVALSAVGINCTTDNRFIKNGKSPMNGLYQYFVPEGGFMHVLPGAENNGGGSSGEIDGLATEQGMYATVAYQRFLDGKTALYDLSDMTLSPEGIAEEKPSSEQTTTESQTDTTREPSKPTTPTITVKVTKIALDYSQISLAKGSSRTLIASILPSNATNRSVTWKSSDPKIATVSSKGLVKGVKAGTAIITVTAKDGSKKKASCRVVVTDGTNQPDQGNGQTPNNQNEQSSNTQTAKPGGQTKSLGGNQSNSNSSHSSNQASGQTKQAGGSNSGDTKKDIDGKNQKGWSFSGEDYVPENNEASTEVIFEDYVPENTDIVEEEGEAEQADSWADKTLTLTIPIGKISYVLLGMMILGGIEILVWYFRKRRRKADDENA